MFLSIRFTVKLFFVSLFVICSLFVLPESRPQLEMNATVGDIVDGETVRLTCSLEYRTRSNGQENIRVTIDHPGAEEIDKVIKRDVIDQTDQISSVVTVKVTSSKDTEQPTLFGPIQCNIHFLPPEHSVSWASNPVQFSSDKERESRILCKSFDSFLFTEQF